MKLSCYISCSDAVDLEIGWHSTPFVDVDFEDEDYNFSFLFRDVSFADCQKIIDEMQRDLDIAKRVYQSSALR